MLGKDLHKDILASLYDGVSYVDGNGIIRYWNKSAELISGFTAEDIVGKALGSCCLKYIDDSGNDVDGDSLPLCLTLNDEQRREGELFLVHKDGHRVPISVKTSLLIDEDGQSCGGIELFSDISMVKASSFRLKELEKIAYLDHLTQLSNRAFIEKELNARINEYSRYGLPFGVIFMDIDNFKGINDSYGHDVGDSVLKMISKTFTVSSRPFDLFGRWGGEEFVGIVRNVDHEQLNVIGERVRKQVEESSLLVGSDFLSVTASLGGTLVQIDDDINKIVARADKLMYSSKTSGKNKITVA